MATTTTIDRSLTAATKNSAAIEKKSNTHAELIIELEDSVDFQTVLTDTTDYAESAVATGTNKEINEIKEMVKQVSASVIAQAETVETLSTKMNGCSSITIKTSYKNKAMPGLHVCTHCKREVYH